MGAKEGDVEEERAKEKNDGDEAAAATSEDGDYNDKGNEVTVAISQEDDKDKGKEGGEAAIAIPKEEIKERAEEIGTDKDKLSRKPEEDGIKKSHPLPKVSDPNRKARCPPPNSARQNNRYNLYQYDTW